METDSGIVVDFDVDARRFDNAMTFDQWWDKEDRDSVPDSDYTFGEEVWKAAQSDTWSTVFQIVSDNPQMATREFIRLLEAARERAGAGPIVEVTA